MAETMRHIAGRNVSSRRL